MQVLAVYPEFSQSDFLADVHEGATLDECLSMLFDPANPPEWDPAGKYRCGNFSRFATLFLIVPNNTAICMTCLGDALASLASGARTGFARAPPVILLPLHAQVGPTVRVLRLGAEQAARGPGYRRPAASPARLSSAVLRPCMRPIIALSASDIAYCSSRKPYRSQ